MRCFLAIPISDNVLEPLVRVQESIEAQAGGFYSWTKTEAMHLTLYFLGDVEQPEAMTEAVAAVEFDRFQISLGGLLLFPDPLSPRVISCGVTGDVGSLTRLQQRISDTVFPIAEFKETRAYFPHITLGRLNRGMPSNAKALKRALSETKIEESAPFKVESFSLIKSTLTSKGPAYETLQTFPAR